MAKLTKEQLLDAVNQLRCCIDEHGGTAGGGAFGSVDVTDKITPDSNLVFNKCIYQAYQIGNMVFFNFLIDVANGQSSAGVAYTIFTIDESILPTAPTANVVYGAGESRDALVSAHISGKINYDGRKWGQGSICWCVENSPESSTKINYSTEEQIIGTWIDGKPLYQKSYARYFAADSLVLLDDTIKHLSHELVDVKGTWAIESYEYDTSSQASIFGKIQFEGYMVSPPDVYLDKDGLQLRINHSDWGFMIHLTIQYTKATD